MDSKTYMLEQLGKRVRRLRNLRKLTVFELTLKSGVDENTIKQLEKGVLDCDVLSLILIAEAMDLKLKDLFIGLTNQPKQQ